jgi:hypothetical protein
MRFFIMMLSVVVFQGCGGGENAATTCSGGVKETKDPNAVEKEVRLRAEKSVVVRGSLFKGGKKPGDFGWMIEQCQYAKTLFVFNDNEQQFSAFINGDRGPMGCSVGGNNGVIRPFQCLDPPRAAGVPTGSNGAGYATLTPQVKALIDRAIQNIRKLATEGDFDTVVFNQSNQDGHPTLAANIFAPVMDVRDHIFDSLLRLNPGA